MYVNVNNNNFHKKKTTCTVLYIQKEEKMRNLYIYIYITRHFSKIKKICVTFLFTKRQILYVNRFFIKKLKLAFIYIQKA